DFSNATISADDIVDQSASLAVQLADRGHLTLTSNVTLHALVDSQLVALEQIAATSLVSFADVTSAGRSALAAKLETLVTDLILQVEDVAEAATVTESALIAAGIVTADELPDANLVDSNGRVSLKALETTGLLTLQELTDYDLLVYDDLTASAQADLEGDIEA